MVSTHIEFSQPISMHRHWHTLIEPILCELEPRMIVEVGVATGNLTRALLGFVRRQPKATLHSIDPAPEFPEAEWADDAVAGRFVLHRELSLNALGELPGPIDVVILDGDHNYFTVFNELRLLQRRARRDGVTFPIVLAHDVGWPYGRRDLYYDPDAIPAKYRKPYRYEGLKPGHNEPVKGEAFNAHLANGIYENDIENGVLTAIEDAVEQADSQLIMQVFPGIHGVALVAPPEAKSRSPLLARLFDDPGRTLLETGHVQRLEDQRLASEVELSQARRDLAKVGKRLADQEEHAQILQQQLSSKITNAETQIETLTSELDALKAQLVTQREEAEQECMAHSEQLEELRQSYEQREADLNIALSDARRERDLAWAELTDATMWVDRLEERLAHSEHQAKTLSTDVERYGRPETLAELLKSKQAEVERLHTTLSARESPLQVRLDAARERLVRARQRAEQWEESWRETTEALERERAERRKESEAHQAELARVYEQVSKLEKELAELSRLRIVDDEVHSQREIEAANGAQRTLGPTQEERFGYINNYEESVRFLEQVVDQLLALIDAIFTSRRWRLGDAIGELWRRVRLLPVQSSARDEVDEIVKRLQEWKAVCNSDSDLEDAWRIPRVGATNGQAGADGTTSAPRPMQLTDAPPPSRDENGATSAHVRLNDETATNGLHDSSDAADSQRLVPAEFVRRFPRHFPEIPLDLAGSSVAVLILTRDGKNHLQRLFESVWAFPQWDAIRFVVVDHGSTDGSLELLEQWSAHLPLEIIRRTTNHTFAASNNLAARTCGEDFLLFLNNDIEFTENIVSHLLQALSDPDVGVAGTVLEYPSDHPYSGKCQHAGIRFLADFDHGFFRPYNDSRVPTEPIQHVAAVTAALAACKRKTFLDVGGFSEAYEYGYEDVDFCLTLRAHGKSCVLLSEGRAWHNESATQKAESRSTLRERRLANISSLQSRYGAEIREAYWNSKLAADRRFASEPLRVAFAVSEVGPSARTGDTFTAMELGSVLKEVFGWSVSYLPAHGDQWYRVANFDVLVVMVDKFELPRAIQNNSRLLTVAWMRNLFDRWVERPWFSEYDLCLSSTSLGIELAREHGKRAELFPIATNPSRFRPGDTHPEYQSDICFTGHRWGVPRQIEELLPQCRIESARIRVFGQGWEESSLAPFAHGPIPYEDIPLAYRSTSLVIDDSVEPHCRGWGSLNSRVFDALASGALVITGCAVGSRDLFGGRIPHYSNKEELEAHIAYYLSRPQERHRLASLLMSEVVEHHTYHCRAERFASLLREFGRERLRISIKVPVPNEEEKESWGDYHFARSLKRHIDRLGHSVRLNLLPQWTERKHDLRDDAVVVLRGLSAYEPQPGRINVMWNISHPDTIGDAEYEAYDVVCVASELLAEQLATRLTVPVHAMLQCTDPDLFFPDVDEAVPAWPLLFVGNSRKQQRPAAIGAIAAGHDPAIFGKHWEGIVSERHLKGQYVPNEQLRKYYSRAGIVLNDHWPTMREGGLISNRIFDAAACGALILTDRVNGLERIFEDSILVFNDFEELRQILNEGRDVLVQRATPNRARDIVIAGHTFAHRAEQLIRVIHNTRRTCQGGDLTINSSGLAVESRPIPARVPSRTQLTSEPFSARVRPHKSP